MSASKSTSVRPKCKFDGCDHQTNRAGLCRAHYKQKLAGKELRPLYLTYRRKGSPPRVICDEAPCANPKLSGHCHVFRGPKDEHGYGRISIGKRLIKLHRHVWEAEVGPIPKGMFIDHQCRNRACCNVDHLRVVTPTVNSTENIVGVNWQLQLAKTHCPQGHPYDEKNTYRFPSGRRHCRTCVRAAKARHLAKHKK